ncbi:hypothetical protein [Spirosoma koreense]
MPVRIGSLLVVAFVCFRCQSSTTEPVTIDSSYFPLETGRYIIYDVQEQQYRLNAAPTERTYQLKEQIGEAYSDVEGQQSYRLMRYRRAKETEPWQADSVWSVRLFHDEAIRAENGKDFVKLVFPVMNRLSWNGNQRNGADRDDYELRNVGQVYYVLDKPFDQTATVVAQDDSTLTAQDRRLEVYARQIGLIYKERTQLQFCTATPACLGHSQIDYGIRQVYRIRTYGKE